MTQSDNSGSPTRVRYLVLAALCLAAIFAYVQRNSIAAAEVTIRHDLSLSKYQMGWVISAFFLTYALFQLPTGYLGKVWGTRRGLSLFVALFSAAAGVFALATGFWFLIGARLVMGAMQAGIFPCAVNTISKWLPDNRRSLASGLLGSSMSVGHAVGMSITGLLLAGFTVWSISFSGLSWRWIFALYCGPGLLFAVVFYRWFRNSPQEHPWVNDAERKLTNSEDSEGAASEPNEPTPWRRLFTDPAIVALSSQQFFRAAGANFFGSWFATYLLETREVKTWVIGVMAALPLWAIVLGSPTGGWVSDWVLTKTGNRRLSRQMVAATAMFVCCLLVLASYPIDNAWFSVFLISGGSFCAAFGGPCAYASTIDMGGKHVPMVFSTMNMAGNIGAFVFPIVVPWLLSERELFVDKWEWSQENAPRVVNVVECESEKSKHNTKLIKKYGENDETVLRFHHGKRALTVLFLESTVVATEDGRRRVRIRFDGRNPPPLRLLINGATVSENIIAEESSGDGLRWSSPVVVDLKEGNNIVRIETETTASGNWDLVLFTFAGIYLAACICWLFANPTRGIGHADVRHSP